MKRRIVWAATTLLALLVAAYAMAALVLPAARGELLRGLFARDAAGTVGHLLGGAAAIGIGAFQINERLRARGLGPHRWLGRIYVLSVLAGGAAALVLSTRSVGGMTTHLGFGALAVCWIGTTIAGYRHIRAGYVEAHREWMLRSYALTLAAVTLRIYLPLSLVAGIPFEPAYRAIAWLCWVPNLIGVETYLRATRRRTQAVAA